MRGVPLQSGQNVFLRLKNEISQVIPENITQHKNTLVASFEGVLKNTIKVVIPAMIPM